jgi:hypothetical protein
MDHHDLSVIKVCLRAEFWFAMITAPAAVANANLHRVGRLPNTCKDV